MNSLATPARMRPPVLRQPIDDAAKARWTAFPLVNSLSVLNRLLVQDARAPVLLDPIVQTAPEKRARLIGDVIAQAVRNNPQLRETVLVLALPGLKADGLVRQGPEMSDLLSAVIGHDVHELVRDIDRPQA